MNISLQKKNNLTGDFCANRARRLVLSRGFDQPRLSGWCDPPLLSVAPRWRWESEMYGYNGQVRWGVSSDAPHTTSRILSPVLAHRTRPLLAPPHAAAAPALHHIHRLSSEMDAGVGGWGSVVNSNRSITQSFTAEQNDVCKKRVLTCWKRGKWGGGRRRDRQGEREAEDFKLNRPRS